MKIIQRIRYPDETKHTPLEIESFTHNIEDDDIREGFEKGKITKATIEFKNEHSIEYELKAT